MQWFSNVRKVSLHTCLNQGSVQWAIYDLICDHVTWLFSLSHVCVSFAFLTVLSHLISSPGKAAAAQYARDRFGFAASTFARRSPLLFRTTFDNPASLLDSMFSNDAAPFPLCIASAWCSRSPPCLLYHFKKADWCRLLPCMVQGNVIFLRGG